MPEYDKQVNNKIRFNWMEFSGSLGDLGLFLPLVVAMTVTAKLDIGVIFIFAGLMNIVTGLLFRQPIPVQPMKAIAVVVITEGLGHGEMAAAGILMGIMMLVMACFIGHVNRFIPKPIIRGIQLGVGIKLAVKGAGWVGTLPFWGLNSMFFAILIGIFLLFLLKKNQPALLYIFLMGFIVIFIDNGLDMPTGFFAWPDFQIIVPSASAWYNGFFKGALPQLPLTTLNSVIAVCALSSDYFPGRGVAPRRMAVSVGMMNLLCVPFGGMPMCHGSGGLAAQYYFGARTGGSVIMLGVMKVMAGLIFGHALLTLLQCYPKAVLGTMLIFAGIELAKAAKDVIDDNQNLILILVMAAFIIGANTFIGFLVGCGLLLAKYVYRKLCFS